MNNAKLEYVISDYLALFLKAVVAQEVVIQKELGMPFLKTQLRMTLTHKI